MEQLIAKGALINAKAADGDTVLHLASHKGHGVVVEVLLARTAAVDARAHSGATTLRADDWGYAKVAEVLLAHGAEVNARTESGMTPLQFARRKDHSAVADLVKRLVCL